MKMPQHPPPFSGLLNKVQKNDKRLVRILENRVGPTHNGRYVHWDKLRRLSPPGDLTHEEWWCGVKLARRGLLRALPLKDKQDRPFRFGLPDEAQEYLHSIDQAGGGRIEMPAGDIATSEARDRYVVHSLIEEAITSSQLEGAVTTRQVAKEMIRSGRAPRDRSERMILNNYLAMSRIRELTDRPLDEGLVLGLHRVLTEDAIDNPSAIGRFRRPDEAVAVSDDYGEVFHEPPPAEQLAGRFAALCDFANGKTPSKFVHPVIRAIILHFWLAYDHPFVDGNGRCARALFYWAMLRQGAWMCEFISISQLIRKAPARYGRAFLYTETDDNDLTYFILYHLDVIRKAFAELQDYIVRKAAALRETEKLVRASAAFNHRQLALLSHALRHADQQYTIRSHMTSHNVVYQTARTDLLDLARRGLLVQRKPGRALYFTPAQELEEKLRNSG